MIVFPKKHPYISATIAATLLAVVVWLCMPKEYSAITKLSDEYKETDLIIGIDKDKVIQRKVIETLPQRVSYGMNSMEVYCKILKTEDFVRSLSHKLVPKKDMTYGEYLGKSDTIKVITKRINYNYSRNHETLTISFTDSDPLVAAQMLDSIIVQLQQVVTSSRHKIAEVALHDAIKKRDVAIKEYHKAQDNYVAFLDSHHTPSTIEAKQHEAALQKEVNLTYCNYNKALESYVREKALLQRAHLSFAVIQNNKVPQTINSSIWAYLLSFIIISLVITFWICQYLKDKSVLNRFDFGNIFAPWTITIILWATIFICILLLGDKLYPLTSQFYVCISLWISIFCLSAFITFTLYQHHDNYNKAITEPLHLNKVVFYLLLAFSLVLSPLCVKKVMDVVGMFNTNNIMEAVRRLANHGDVLGFLDICFIINKALLLVILWKYPKISKKIVVLVLFLLFLNSLAIMDKGTIFFVIIAIIFVLYEKKKIRIAHMLTSAIVVVGLFFVLTVMRDRSGNYADLDIFFFLNEYIFANPVAFGYMPESISTQFGTNSLFLFYDYLRRLGIGNFFVLNELPELSYVPIPTNLYTVMMPFFLDFGTIGVAFFSFVYGVGMGWCYRLYKNGNSTGKCMYIYIVYVLLFQFGHEQIFLNPYTFLRTWLLVYLMTQTRFKLSLR